ncbi:MAG: PKD domain-containing protein [Bacteroidetes bacterium]|nr:PKD domain-containing protein [Bacteroidota bacterium]
MIKRAFYYILLLLPFYTVAQNCAVQVSNNIVCVGNTVSFTVTYNSGLTVKNFSWNFGDATIGTVSLNNSHLYSFAGIYNPILNITFTNLQTCIVNVPTLKVVNKPIANYVFTTSKTQCNKNNSICIKDISSKGLNGAGIKSRLILWDDGSFVNSLDATTFDYCNNYQNPFGRKYSIVLEVTDSNNCISRIEKTDSATIYTAMQSISFNTQLSFKCDTTFATLINTSQFPQNQVKKFYWDFGDGTVDSSGLKWSSISHSYNKTGVFYPKLTVVNFDGCKQDTTFIDGIKNVKLANKIIIEIANKCYSNLGYNFKTDSMDDDVSYTWTLFNLSNNILDVRSKFKVYTLNKSNVVCGKYKLNLMISYKNCFKSIDTIFDIYGPITKIFDPGNPVQNLNQCHVTDTIYFITPNPDISCYYKNAIKRLWDFADPFAPPCTLDTKKNINVGLNCRYSRDSIRVKHWYTPGNERCYPTTLSLTDTVTLCSSTDTVSVSIMPPNAKPGLTETPKRKGLTWTGKACIDYPITFDIIETLPRCSRTAAWVRIDSADSKGKWIKIDSTKTKITVFYPYTTDLKGWVTVGLIIQNGICFDTAWYHNFLDIIPLKSSFSVKVIGTCQPYTLNINPIDSIQDSLSQVMCFIDNNLVSTQNFALTDSVIKPITLTILKQGKYNIILQVYNRKGCSELHDTTVILGFSKTFAFSKPIVCLKDSVQLLNNILYYDSSTPFWDNKIRAANNKEKIWWQVNKEGFNYQGSMPKLYLSKVGNYTITMVAKDSLNCTDTVVSDNSIKVVSLDAGIKQMQQLYVCAPKVALFQDSTVVMDSSALFGDLPYDNVSSRTWHFGDNKNDAFAADPIHEYTTNNKFTAYLAVQTTNGCIDTAIINIEIKGPNPSFGILKGDTFGCSPVSITLKNLTGRQIDDWIWSARGPINYVISTQKDTDVTFKFTVAGIYNLRIYGSENVLNPVTNNLQNCVASFPDSLNPNSPVFKVRVVDRPNLSFTAADTLCINESFNILSNLDPIFANYTLDFGDGRKRFADTSEKIINTSYSNPGIYILKLIGHTNQKLTCVDTPSKSIFVRNLKADFAIDASKNPTFKFISQSINATSYKWTFGVPQAGKQDTSNEVNPSFDYSNYLNTSDSIKVCLIASNNNGCFDTICKKIYPFAKGIKLYNVFSPDGDGQNDAFDIDIKGSSKYELSIYNRWGDIVFESTKDGIGNDGNNWNGKLQNTGADCSIGTYVYVFKYRFIGQNSDIEERGTITLIR